MADMASPWFGSLISVERANAPHPVTQAVPSRTVGTTSTSNFVSHSDSPIRWRGTACGL